MKLKTAVLVAAYSLLSLIQIRADPSADLVDAAERGDLAAVSALVQQGADVNAQSGKYKFTALTNAADNGHVDIISFLIDHKANLDLADNQGSTPLLHSCNTNQTAAALALLKAGANPNLGSHWKRTPLMYAAQKGNDDIVAALIAAKADVAATCNQGPALLWATCNNHTSTAKLLFAAGAAFPAGDAPFGFEPGQMHYTMLGLAACNNNPDLIDLFVSKGADVNAAASDGNTPLMNTAEWNAINAAGPLILKGAKIDAKNNFGQTALHVAIIYGAKDVFHSLLDYHAGIEVKDNNGYTPLITACAHGEDDMAADLILRGANVNAIDNKGETALTHAGSKGDINMVRSLTDDGATRTDLHILATENPAIPLTPAQSWALAVGAVYTEWYGLDHKVLGGGDNPVGAKNMLRAYWGVNSKASLLKQINELLHHGHRELYQKEGLALISMSNDDFQKYLAGKPAHADQIKQMRQSYLTWKDRSGLAWDLCRASMLVNQGYAAHYLKDDDAWKTVLPVAQDVQKNFSSWQEMAANYLDGRLIWDNKHEPYVTACADLLLDPKDPNSPWNYLPWKTELTTN